MMLDKNQIRSVSFQFIKQQKQHTTSARLAQELVTNIQCSGASRSFATEVRALKVQEHSGLPLGGDKGRLRGSSKLVLLNLHEKLPKKSVSTIRWLFDIWIKLERWKHSISGCLMSWPRIKKIVILKCHLILHNNNKRVLNCIVTYDTKWILYDNRQQPAQWLE